MVCATENTHFSARVTRCLLGLGLAFSGRQTVYDLYIHVCLWYTRQTTGRNKYTG